MTFLAEKLPKLDENFGKTYLSTGCYGIGSCGDLVCISVFFESFIHYAAALENYVFKKTSSEDRIIMLDNVYTHFEYLLDEGKKSFIKNMDKLKGIIHKEDKENILFQNKKKNFIQKFKDKFKERTKMKLKKDIKEAVDGLIKICEPCVKVPLGNFKDPFGAGTFYDIEQFAGNEKTSIMTFLDIFKKSKLRGNDKKSQAIETSLTNICSSEYSGKDLNVSELKNMLKKSISEIRKAYEPELHRLLKEIKEIENSVENFVQEK